MARNKKNSQTRLAWMLSGLAFFTLMSAYAIFKLEATMNRPRELPIETVVEKVEKVDTPNMNESLIYFAQNTENSVSDDKQNWRDAEATLVQYFEGINIGEYSKAVSLRTPDYLIGTPEAYALQLKSSMENDISGKLKITSVERIPDESKLTTKYFRFQKTAVWSFDNSTHSEIRKAAIVLRDGKWTIDFFEVERKF